MAPGRTKGLSGCNVYEHKDPLPVSCPNQHNGVPAYKCCKEQPSEKGKKVGSKALIPGGSAMQDADYAYAK